MKIIIAIFIVFGFSLPGLSQSLRDQKIIYAQTRCQELQEAQLLGDSRKKENWSKCISYFETNFEQNNFKYRNMLLDEYVNTKPENMCRHVELGWKYNVTYWFGRINNKDISQAYNDCLAFYNGKKVSSPGKPAIIPDNVDDALDQLLEQKMLEMGN